MPFLSSGLLCLDPTAWGKRLFHGKYVAEELKSLWRAPESSAKFYKWTHVNPFNLYTWGDQLEKTAQWQMIVIRQNQPVHWFESQSIWRICILKHPSTYRNYKAEAKEVFSSPLQGEKMCGSLDFLRVWKWCKGDFLSCFSCCLKQSRLLGWHLRTSELLGKEFLFHLWRSGIPGVSLNRLWQIPHIDVHWFSPDILEILFSQQQ